MLFAAIGEGTLAAFTGILMKIDPDMLFYSMCFMNTMLLLLVFKTVKAFQ